MSKYSMMVRILDKICEEAIGTKYEQKYNPPKSDNEKVNQARSRAFVHLYMKVSFGVLDFKEREECITDGAYDGGIDGYYLDHEAKTVYFIQSKFRTTEDNFESKSIKLEEILVMDINRILEGEECDEAGNEYNGKIKGMLRAIVKIDDLARYRYKVIILANVNKISDSKLRMLSGGYAV
ncbi:hypothetical protein [Azospirillum sp. SYSU D00513]|uniref:hypothetical protein n=1 Tax=Azospirillum sp. SYSU D00513 TaxID=2812561 RepID=UPI001A9643C1|nr:hypothetical protein [Azospirillum sp. SYSU D00513]